MYSSTVYVGYCVFLLIPMVLIYLGYCKLATRILLSFVLVKLVEGIVTWSSQRQVNVSDIMLVLICGWFLLAAYRSAPRSGGHAD